MPSSPAHNPAHGRQTHRIDVMSRSDRMERD
jgi:hypothetical protein